MILSSLFHHRPFFPLTTERLILRAAQKEEAAALAGLGLYTPEEEQGKALLLVIEHLQGGALMGILEIAPHLHCILGKDFQKKGYGHEAASALIYILFSLFEHEEITALAPTPSPFLEKLGFHLKSAAAQKNLFHLTRAAFFKKLGDRKKRPLVWVGAGALIRPDGALFLARRQAHQSFPGAWELPGGKIEPGESPEGALIREMEEEVGVTLEPPHLKPLSLISHPYETLHIMIHFYVCFQWKGTPYGKEGQEVAWVFPENLPHFPTPAAGVPFLYRLVDELAPAHPKWQALQG